jgi:hypothetical protein
MAEIRTSLHRRLADYVLNNESRIRAETMGEESYSFCLQQMDEMFLNKLTVVERTVAELGRSESREGQPTATTYEAVELVARREDLPQKVADALADHGDSDFLELCPLRVDDKQAEVLLVLAREETGVPMPGTPSDPDGRDGLDGSEGTDCLGGMGDPEGEDGT